MKRIARPRWAVAGASAFALIVASSACKDDSEADARRYQTAQAAFIASVRSESARLADPIAAAVLERRVVGDQSPSAAVVAQFKPQYDAFNQPYCSQLKALGKAIDTGSGSLKARRLEEMRVAAGDFVFDTMASALLQGALGVPSEQRDPLLAAVGVEGIRARDGAPLSGLDALEEAGLVDDNGRFAFPERGTAEYARYKTWYSSHAEGFAGLVDILIGPTRAKLDECFPAR